MLFYLYAIIVISLDVKSREYNPLKPRSENLKFGAGAGHQITVQGIPGIVELLTKRGNQFRLYATKLEGGQKVITKDKTISEVLDENPATAEVFMKHGMGCLGCAVASGETVEEAASVHGIDVNVLLSELNEAK